MNNLAILVETMSQCDYMAGDGRSSISQLVVRKRVNMAKAHHHGDLDKTRDSWVSRTYMTKHMFHRYFHPGERKEKCVKWLSVDGHLTLA